MQRHRKISLSAAILSVMPVFAQTQNLTPAALALRAKGRDAPEIPYESVPNLLKFPANLYLGEGIGVATNSKGHIFATTGSSGPGCLNSMGMETTSARSARACMASCLLTR